MLKIVYKDLFLTASVGCYIEPEIIHKKHGTIIYPNKVSLREEIYDYLDKEDEPEITDRRLLTSTGDVLCTSEDEEILFN